MAPGTNTKREPMGPLKKHKRRMAYATIPLWHFWPLMSATLYSARKARMWHPALAGH